MSRDTFFRYQEAKATGGVEALLGKNRRRPNLKNCIDQATESAVLAYAMEHAHGQESASATSYASEARLSALQAFARSGCAMVWLTSNSTWLH